jgi:putative sugar O-methyltransferase
MMTPLEEARTAWRQNDLQRAVVLATQLFAQQRSPEHASLLATLLHQVGRAGEARELLVSCVAQAPYFLPAYTQLSRIIKEDARKKSQEAQKEIAERRQFLARAKAELEKEPFFKPSEFWNGIALKHERMLDASGIGNFKRTLAHNYQNWLMTDGNDRQWQRLKDIWQKAPFDQPFLNTIEAVDDDGFIWDLSLPSYPLSSPGNMALYKFAVGVLWELALAGDKLEFLADYQESEIGNPIRIRRNGQLISQDAAHSCRELNTLFSVAGLSKDQRYTFAELGAGQGRLAEMVGRSTSSRYLIFDIPPTLAVSQWYIQQLFPSEKIFTFREFSDWSEVRESVESSRFAFFTPNQIRHLPEKSVDVFINICSLMEMRKDQVRFFLDTISRVTSKAFFSKQWYKWRNPVDNIEVSKDDSVLGNGFSLSFDQPDQIYEDLFVQVWLESGRS